MAMAWCSHHPAHAAITYFASASNPADNGTLGAATVAVTPPASMVTGDLVIVVAHSRSVGTIDISATGGQAWTAEALYGDVFGEYAPGRRLFWARYNGTWSADPSVSFGSTSNTTVVMHVFRPTLSSNTWTIDVAATDANYDPPSAPYDVPVSGVTTVTNGALVFAAWMTPDDHTWQLQTAGWSNAGAAHYRNLASFDTSQSSAYTIMPTAGASGNVVNRQTTGGTLGADNGNTIIMAFKETTAVSGAVYTDEGVTQIADGAVIRLIVNGVDNNWTGTTSGGTYVISAASLSAGDAILVYIDGHATDGATVTVSNGGSLTGLDIYGAHLIVRHDNAGTVTNARLSAAKGALSDVEMLYSVDGSNHLTVSAGTELYLPSGHSYAPGANVTTPTMESQGAFSGGGGDIDSNGALVVSGGSFTASSGATRIGGNYTLSAGTFVHNNGTVTFDAPSGTILISPGGQSFFNVAFNDASGSATYQLQGALTAANDLTVTDGILDTKNTFNYAITVARDFSQTGGRVLAQSSTVTVGRNFTADGTELSTGFNAASLVLTGSGGLTYSNLATPWTNGFNNLTVGQGGNTTTSNNNLAVNNLLTVGSGTLTGSRAVYLNKVGATPLVFDPASTVSVLYLKFFASGAQTIPTLNNGYDANIDLAGLGTTLTQLGNITINAGKSLILDGDTLASRVETYNTAGFALTVGGNIQIGVGGDTGLKTFDGTNSTITVGGNIDIRSGATTFTSTGSTVILNGAALQTVLMNGENFASLTITNAGAAGVQFLDGFTAANITDATAASKLTLKAGATYTVSGTLTLAGAGGGEITLQSDVPGTRFTLNVTGGAQTVSYVTVRDSQSSGNNITANNSIDGGGNDTAEAAPHWIFAFLCPVVTSVADSGAGTLRDCIDYANTTPGPNTITFNITGCPGGLCTIAPTSGLPALSDATGGTTIDGYTQSGASTNTVPAPGASNAVLKVQLSGGGASYAGLTLSSANNVVRGLVINGFSGVGAGSGLTITGATSNTVAGNYVGTNAAGTTAAGNYFGVYLINGAQANTIGGTTPADRNLVSGNTSEGVEIVGVTTSGNFVIGNYIGTDVGGVGALGNTFDGVGLYAPSNTIGGATVAARNIIAGNGGDGVVMGGGNATGNAITGNFIGVDVNGAARPNGQSGVRINLAANANNVGGVAAGEGNTIAYNGVFGLRLASTGNQILGNAIYGNTQAGVNSLAGNQTIALNVIRNNGGVTYDGVVLAAGATNNKLYHNTIHANGASGVSINDTGAVLRNNLITGHGAYGINRLAAAMTESSNDVTDNVVTPASIRNASGRSNPAGILDATDLNADPLYVNAGAGTFTLTECTSPAIDQGADLGVDQPDVNGAAAGLFNGVAPDMGALETSCVVTPMLVKQVWSVGGTSPMALTNGVPASVVVPSGSSLVFLIYLKNASGAVLPDVRFQDLLDVSATGFTYTPGSLVRTSAAAPPADTASDLAIFNATAPGPGAALTDGVDGDVGSICDSTGAACPGTVLNRITVGNTTGLSPAQANGTLSVPANSTFAIRFHVTK